MISHSKAQGSSDAAHHCQSTRGQLDTLNTRLICNSLFLELNWSKYGVIDESPLLFLWQFCQSYKTVKLMRIHESMRLMEHSNEWRRSKIESNISSIMHSFWLAHAFFSLFSMAHRRLVPLAHFFRKKPSLAFFSSNLAYSPTEKSSKDLLPSTKQLI